VFSVSFGRIFKYYNYINLYFSWISWRKTSARKKSNQTFWWLISVSFLLVNRISLDVCMTNSTEKFLWPRIVTYPIRLLFLHCKSSCNLLQQRSKYQVTAMPCNSCRDISVFRHAYISVERPIKSLCPSVSTYITTREQHNEIEHWEILWEMVE